MSRRPPLRPKSGPSLSAERLEDRITPVSFGAAYGVDTPGNAMSVAVGDLNGSGGPDLVVGTPSGVGIYLNDGTGHFTGTSSVSLGNPQAVNLVDLNGDGKLDLLVADGFGGDVDIALGNGDGTFQTPIVQNIGTHPQAAFAADIRGNGKMDVVVDVPGGVAIMLNDGSAGIVGPPTFYYPSPAPDTVGVITRDFNGDGKLDIALAGYGGDRIDVLFNAGDGTFGPATVYPLAEHANGMVTGDFNGDGRLDLAVGYSYLGTVGVLLGNADGTFQSPVDYPTGVTTGRSVATADLDLDGNLDLVVLDQDTNQKSILLGDGHGGFGAPIPFSSAFDPAAVVIADVNGDGKPDLITTASTSPGSVAVTPNTTPAVSSFGVTAVAAATAGQGFDVTVTAEDASAATFTGYAGTVHFTSTDPLATAGGGLPADYTFVAADNGVHTFHNVTLETAGAVTITVADPRRPAAAGSAVVAVSPSTAAAVGVVSGSGQSATVSTSFGSPLVAVVTDLYGNPVSGVVVTFAGPASGAGVAFPAGPTATTGADGRASLAVQAGTTAGGYTVTATVAGVVSPASFTLTNTAGAAAGINPVSGDGQTATVNTGFAGSLTVLVTDLYGNPVSGVVVTFSGPATGAGVAFPAGSTATTGADGRASLAVGAGTTAGGYAVTATVAGGASPASFTLTNTAGAAAGINLVSGDGQTATVGTGFGAPLVAVVTDTFGNPVAGVVVTFSGPASGAGVTFPAGSTATTGVDGQASLAVEADTTAGGYAVTATAPGVSAPASFTLTNAAGLVTDLAVTGFPTADTAGVAHPVTVTAVDAFGNIVPAYTGTVHFTSTDPLATAGGGLPPDYTFGPADGGTKTFPGVVLETSGPESITATDIGDSSVTGVETGITVRPGPAAVITPVSGDGQSATVNADFGNPLVVVVADAYGNPVSGVVVTFAGPASGAGVTFPTGSTATTGADGHASLAVRAGTTTGAYTVAATVAGGSSPASFTLTNTVGTVATVRVGSGSGQTATVGAGFATSLVAVVTDPFGNPVPGVAVTFAGPVSGAGVTFPDGLTATTGADGRASLAVQADTTAGGYTVTATVAGLPTPASFTLTNTAGPATTISAASGDGQTAVVSTAFAHPLAVLVTDQYGNPVTGATVTFAGPASGAGVTFPTGATATTGADGRASLTVRSGTVVGGYAVTATVAGGSSPASFTLTNTVGAATVIRVGSGNGQTATVGTGFGGQLVAVVTDPFGNPVPGVTVTFSGPTTGAGVTFPAGATATTGPTGQVSLAVNANTAAGGSIVTATAAGVLAPALFALTNTAGAAAIVSPVSGDGQSATVTSGFTSPLVAVVTDVFGNPVSGAAVTFTGPAAGAGVTFPTGATATTGSNGRVSLAVAADAAVGGYTVTAAVAGVSSPAAFALTNTVGPVATVSAMSGGGQTATVNTGFAGLLTVLVTDPHGNPVPGVAVTFAGPASGAGVTFPAGVTATTGADGRASLAVRAGTVVGGYAVTATVAGLSTPASFTLVNAIGPAAVVRPVSGGGQTAAVNTSFEAALVAVVTDQFGNPVPGVAVTFTGPPTGAGVSFPAGTTATTGADGRASLAVRAGATAGKYAATAAVTGVSAPASFALANTAPAPLTISGAPNGGAVMNTTNPSTPGEYSGSPGSAVTPFGPIDATVRTVTADVDGDGIPDSVLVTGPGVPIRVAVVSGADNSTVLVQPFDPFGGNFVGGGFVAAGDFEHTGRAEFVVTPDQGGGPRVSIFAVGADGAVSTLANFFGIDDPNFRGGARAAAGDVNHDGTPDVVVAAGFGGGPRVAIFDGTTLLTSPTRLVSDFFAFPGADATTLRNGTFVAVGDVDGDGYGDLIFGGGPGGAPRVYILNGRQVLAGDVAGAQAAPIANFFVGGSTTDRGGVRVAAVDADGDARMDVAVGSGQGDPARVRVYLGKNFIGPGEPADFQDVSVFGGAVLTDGVYVS